MRVCVPLHGGLQELAEGLGGQAGADIHQEAQLGVRVEVQEPLQLCDDGGGGGGGGEVLQGQRRQVLEHVLRPLLALQVN